MGRGDTEGGASVRGRRNLDPAHRDTLKSSLERSSVRVASHSLFSYDSAMWSCHELHMCKAEKKYVVILCWHLWT